MRYLSKWNLFESDLEFDTFSKEAVKEVFESYINWNMIHDAKDLALELLDSGLTLNIEVDYNEEIPIYSLKFSHSINRGGFDYFKLDNSYRVPDGVYSLEPIDKKSITYNIFFTTPVDYYGEVRLYSKRKLEDEFMSELMDRYPDMKKYINIHYEG